MWNNYQCQGRLAYYTVFGPFTTAGGKCKSRAEHTYGVPVHAHGAAASVASRQVQRGSIWHPPSLS